LRLASAGKALPSPPAFRAPVDPEVLAEYLQLRFVCGERSRLKNVHQLRPGHCVRVTADGATGRRYWQVPDEDKTEFSAVETVDRLDMLLRNSVASQLLSDVKVGCQLSGGIDSSLVSVMARSGFTADMDTFSVVFDNPALSEERWISIAANKANADSHRFHLTPRFFFDIEFFFMAGYSASAWMTLTKEERAEYKVIVDGAKATLRARSRS